MILVAWKLLLSKNGLVLYISDVTAIVGLLLAVPFRGLLMASTAVVLFFRSADGIGWSERYFYSGVLIDPAFSANINALLNARAQLLTTSATILYARVGSPTKRNPYVFFPPAGGVPGTFPTPTAPTEVALLVKLVAGIIGFNRIFLRGIPDAIINGDTYVPTPAWTSVFNAYRTLLLAGLYNAQGTLGSPTMRHPISTLTPVSPRGYNFLQTPVVLTVGTEIRVAGALVPGYNGRKTVTQINNPTGSVTVGGAAPGAADPSMSVFYTNIATYDQGLTSVDDEKLTRRAPGLPFGHSRGRAPTLYSLRR